MVTEAVYREARRVPRGVTPRRFTGHSRHLEYPDLSITAPPTLTTTPQPTHRSQPLASRGQSYCDVRVAINVFNGSS
jgi:hypothetical protein